MKDSFILRVMPSSVGIIMVFNRKKLDKIRLGDVFNYQGTPYRIEYFISTNGTADIEKLSAVVSEVILTYPETEWGYGMSPDQKFYWFVQAWAQSKGCRFVEQACDGGVDSKLIDGMEVDDIWGWLIPARVAQQTEKNDDLSDGFFGCIEWHEVNGKVLLEWNTYDISADADEK